MQIIATPNSPFGNAKDISFKTVTAAVRFIVRSYYEKNAEARHVEVYIGTAPIIQIEFVTKGDFLLTKGTVDGWPQDETQSLEQVLQLVKNLHKEG